jgi:uncharacterized membrane protein
MASFLNSLRPLLHPILVHFPIALLFASVALDLVGYIFRITNLTRAGFYVLALGVAGAGVAAIVGPDHATGSATADALLIAHQNFALLTVALGVSLLLVRFFSADGIVSPWALLYFLVALALLGALALTGYYGGELTYHQGAGVVTSSGPVIIPAGPITDVHTLVKPLVALMGLATVTLMGGWLLFGKRLAPHYYPLWMTGLRGELGTTPGNLWTLRRGSFAAQKRLARVSARSRRNQ